MTFNVSKTVGLISTQSSLLIQFFVSVPGGYIIWIHQPDELPGAILNCFLPIALTILPTGRKLGNPFSSYWVESIPGSVRMAITVRQLFFTSGAINCVGVPVGVDVVVAVGVSEGINVSVGDKFAEINVNVGVTVGENMEVAIRSIMLPINKTATTPPASKAKDVKVSISLFFLEVLCINSPG